eukprot:scaffold222700_cov17-Tisochrysis_lutea.AAC.1
MTCSRHFLAPDMWHQQLECWSGREGQFAPKCLGLQTSMRKSSSKMPQEPLRGANIARMSPLCKWKCVKTSTVHTPSRCGRFMFIFPNKSPSQGGEGQSYNVACLISLACSFEVCCSITA